MLRTTPFVTQLKANEIFVFRSNEAGRHGKRAAKLAKKWGAKYRVGCKEILMGYQPKIQKYKHFQKKK